MGFVVSDVDLTAETKIDKTDAVKKAHDRLDAAIVAAHDARLRYELARQTHDTAKEQMTVAERDLACAELAYRGSVLGLYEP